jgi:hypothetical protein
MNKSEIEAWQWELAVQVQKCRQTGTDDGRKKADFLEGFYSALTCLARAKSGSPSPLSKNENQ